MSVNLELLGLARHALMEKVAVVPPGGGAPPMDPAMGGAPPMDPAMGGMPPGGAPPMDPAMGGAPPMDPAMGGMPPGGAPPMDPAMAGGAPPPGDPAAAAGAGGAKMKPEQMMQMLDFRLYNIQMQLTTIMGAMDLSLPPGALVTPPGSPVPVAEAAAPGGPQDPTQAMGAGVGDGGEDGGGGSAISPIEPMQGAAPGGMPKQASHEVPAESIGSPSPYNGVPRQAETMQALLRAVQQGGGSLPYAA